METHRSLPIADCRLPIERHHVTLCSVIRTLFNRQSSIVNRQ